MKRNLSTLPAPGASIDVRIGRVVIDRAALSGAGLDTASLQAAIAARLGAGDATAAPASPLGAAIADAVAQAVAARLAEGGPHQPEH